MALFQTSILRRRSSLTMNSPHGTGRHRGTTERTGRSVHFWLLSVFFVLVMISGGSTRANLQSLLVIRPVAVLLCGYALLGLRWAHVRAFPWLFALLAAAWAVPALQLVPLPPEMWQSLPGRELVAQADKVAGLGAVWRPISMTPSQSWNALYSLFVPAAMLLLLVQMPGRDVRAMLPVLGAMLVLSGLVGFIQVVGPAGSPLYYYESTNRGSAVGLFANRNHQALAMAMCFPVLALLATHGARSQDQYRGRVLAAGAVAAVLIPLLLVTGSRAGLVLGLIGMAVARFMVVRDQALAPAKRRARGLDPRVVWAGAGVVALVMLSLAFARAEAIQRLLFATGGEGELRFGTWGAMVDAAIGFLPFGGGAGGFVALYKIGELHENLGYLYMNRAHNELIEVAMTTGLPGLALVLVATGAVVAAARRWFLVMRRGDRDTCFGRLGTLILLMGGLASLVDYPLHVPSHMCIAVLAAMWASGAAADRRMEAASMKGMSA